MQWIHCNHPHQDQTLMQWTHRPTIVGDLVAQDKTPAVCAKKSDATRHSAGFAIASCLAQPDIYRPAALSQGFADAVTRAMQAPAPVSKMCLKLRLRCRQERVARLYNAIAADDRLTRVQAACARSWMQALHKAAICVGNDGRKCAHVDYERAIQVLSVGVHRTTGRRRLARLVSWKLARDAYLTVADAFKRVIQIPLLDEKWVLANRDVLQANNRKKEENRRAAKAPKKCARTHKHPPQNASAGDSYRKFCNPPPFTRGDTFAGRLELVRCARGRFAPGSGRRHSPPRAQPGHAAAQPARIPNPVSSPPPEAIAPPMPESEMLAIEAELAGLDQRAQPGHAAAQPARIPTPAPAPTADGPQAASQAQTPGRSLRIAVITDAAAARAELAALHAAELAAERSAQAKEPSLPRPASKPALPKPGRQLEAPKPAPRPSQSHRQADDGELAQAAWLVEQASRSKWTAAIGLVRLTDSELPKGAWRAAMGGLAGLAPGAVRNPAGLVRHLARQVAMGRVPDPRAGPYYRAHAGWGRALLALANVQAQ